MEAVYAFVNFVVTVGEVVAGAAGITIPITTAGTVTAAIIGTTAIVGGTIGLSKLYEIEMNVPDTDYARQRTVKGGTQPVKTVYGEALVSGPIAFVGAGNTNNSSLYHVIALTGHESEAITDMYFDNVKIQNSDINGGSAAGGAVGGSTIYGPVNSTTITYINKHLGDESTADTMVNNEFAKWTDDHVGEGVTYIATQFYFPDDSDIAEVWNKHTPNDIKALVKGVNTIYDPRDDTGGNGDNPASASFQSWSDNPALCLANYLTNDVWGMGIATSKVDWDAVADAADYCDELQSIPGSATQKRFTCNGVLFGTEAHQNNVSKLLSSMNGSMVYTGGKYVITAGQYIAPTHTLTEDDLNGHVTLTTTTKRSDRFNTVTGVFNDPDQLHKQVEFPKVQISSAVTRDNSEVLSKQIQLSMTNNVYMAQRLAYQMIKRSNDQMVLDFPANLKGLRVAIGDRVQVTINQFAGSEADPISFVNKVFVCTNFSFTDSNAGGVNLTLVEDTEANYYDATVSPALIMPVAAYSSVDLSDGSITDGFRGVPAPSSLSAVGVAQGIALTWTNPLDPLEFDNIKIYRVPGTASTFVSGDVDQIYYTKNNFYNIFDIAENTTFTFWIEAIKAGSASSKVGPDSATAGTLTADSIPWTDVTSRNIGVGINASDEITLTGVDTDSSDATGQAIAQSGIEQDIVITQGGMTVDGGGAIRSEGRDDVDFSSGDAGFFLGYDSTAYKFGVGNSSENMVWDGSNLNVTGGITATSGTFAGSVNVNSSGKMYGGSMTTFNSGAGFFLGYDTDAYKFSVGDSTSKVLTWDGDNLNVQANIVSFTTGGAPDYDSNSRFPTSMRSSVLDLGSNTDYVFFDNKFDQNLTLFAGFYAGPLTSGTISGETNAQNAIMAQLSLQIQYAPNNSGTPGTWTNFGSAALSSKKFTATQLNSNYYVKTTNLGGGNYRADLATASQAATDFTGLGYSEFAYGITDEDYYLTERVTVYGFPKGEYFLRVVVTVTDGTYSPYPTTGSPSLTNNRRLSIPNALTYTDSDHGTSAVSIGNGLTYFTSASDNQTLIDGGSISLMPPEENPTGNKYAGIFIGGRGETSDANSIQPLGGIWFYEGMDDMGSGPGDDGSPDFAIYMPPEGGNLLIGGNVNFNNNVDVDGTLSINGVTVNAGAVTGPAGSDGQIQYNNGGALGGSSNLTFNDSTNTLSVTNLTVSGTTTTIDTTNLNVSDKNITLNYGTGDTSANADGAGITIQDAVNSSTDATILWSTSSETFDFSHGATFAGQVEFPSAYNKRPVLTGGFLGRQTGDGDVDIWGISETYYPSAGTTTNAWGIRWASSPNEIQFVGGNSNRVRFDLDNGNTVIGGSITSGSITSSGKVTVSGSSNSYSTAPVVYFDSTSTADAGVRDWAIGPADDAYGNFHIFVGASTGADPVNAAGRLVTITNAGDTTIRGTVAADRLGYNAGDYSYLSQTASGATTILGHNVRAHATVNNRADTVNGSWHGHAIAMYYDRGISFYTTSSTVTAGTTLFSSNTDQTNLRLRILPNGNFDFRSGSFSSVGTITSGAITSTGDSAFGKIAVGTDNDNAWSTLWVERDGINLATEWSHEDASNPAHLTLAGANAHVRMLMGTMDVSPYGVYIQGSYDNTPDDSGTGSSGTEPIHLNPLGGNVSIGSYAASSYTLDVTGTLGVSSSVGEISLFKSSDANARIKIQSTYTSTATNSAYIDLHTGNGGRGYLIKNGNGAGNSLPANSLYLWNAESSETSLISNATIGRRFAVTSGGTATKYQDTSLGSTFVSTSTNSGAGQGFRVIKSYVSGDYVSLIEAPYSSGTNADIRLAAKFTGSGSSFHFGTSDSYGYITKEPLVLDHAGNAYIKQIVGGQDGDTFTVPIDQDTGYSNHSFGGWGLLHREAYDSYITSNAYYYRTSDASSWYSKYANRHVAALDFVDGQLVWRVTGTKPTAANTAVSISEVFRIHADGGVTAKGLITADDADIFIDDSLTSGNSSAYTDANRLRFSNSHTDVARGPNKITMYDNGSNWSGGFGIHSGTVSYYSGAAHAWYKITGLTTSDISERMVLNTNGELKIYPNTNLSMSSGGQGHFTIQGSGYTGAITLDGNGMHLYHNSASRDLILGTNETAAITINGANQSTFITSTTDDAFFVTSSHSTNARMYLRNSNATAGNVAEMYFAPANNIATGLIRFTADEDASTSANRSASMLIQTRADGTWYNAIQLDKFGRMTAEMPKFNSDGTADDALVSRWIYKGYESSYRLDLHQRVTSNVVRYSFGQVNNSTSYNDVLVFDRGNLGVKTQDPAYQLDVVGTTRIKASGNGYSNGSLIIEESNTSSPSATYITNVSGTTFISGSSSADHFYMRSNGRVILKNTNAPSEHAALNIGFVSGETRAIDIDGSWSSGESKSISFTHGTTTSNLVGQIKMTYNIANGVNNNSGGSVLQIGRFYHGQDLSSYPVNIYSQGSVEATVHVQALPTGTTAANRAFQVNTTGYGAIHAIGNQNGTNGSADTIGMVTIGGNTGVTVQGGIYASQNSATGTSIAIFVTDSYASGPKQTLSCLDTGEVQVNRGQLTVDDAITCDEGNLILGDDAFSVSSGYTGIKTAFQSGVNDYMIISGTADGHTYISAKDAHGSHLRGGGNNGNNQIYVPDSSYITATTSNFYVTGNVTAYYSSDARLKHSVRNIKNPLQKLHQINGVHFLWNDEFVDRMSGGEIDFRKDDVGVIAQEVKEVLDEVVAEREDGYLAVKYEKLTPLLIEGLKEADRKIEAQQKQIDQLIKLIGEMKNGDN